MIGYSNEYGNVSYTDDVLAKIVGLSTMECYGVVGMVSKTQLLLENRASQAGFTLPHPP